MGRGFVPLLLLPPLLAAPRGVQGFIIPKGTSWGGHGCTHGDDHLPRVMSRSGSMSWSSVSSTCLSRMAVSTPPAPGAAAALVDEDVLDELAGCTSGVVARRLLDRAIPMEVVPGGSGKGGDKVAPSPRSRIYNSLSIPRGASSLPVSDADLAIQTKVRNTKYSVMELIELNGDLDADRASAALFAITLGSSLSAVGAGEVLISLPEVMRFIVVWILAFAPLAFVGTGLASPAWLASVLVGIQRAAFPSYRKRMLQHEAGHFLLGHLLGYPIKSYTANAVRNAVELYPLRDKEMGRERAMNLGFDVDRRREVETSGREISNDGYIYDGDDDRSESSSNTPYFSEKGRGESDLRERSVFRDGRSDPARRSTASYPSVSPTIPESNDPTRSWPYRGLDEDTLDCLSVVSVGGVCAEILAFGNAEGGYADLSQLRIFFAAAADSVMSDDGDKKAENRIRYSVGYGITQLRRHMGALDALVEVMERDGTVAECVLAIENCPSVSGVGGLLGGSSDVERTRRERIRMDGVGLLERFLLCGGKNSDAEDDGVLLGDGGGGRKARFVLTGDDPLYVAGALAFSFFIWASNGGLSLH